MEKKLTRLSNNETYAYVDTASSKEVLVLVHGNMSSGVHYKPLIERFRDIYRVIAPDLRGFGDTTYNQPINSLEDLSDDLYLLLTQLKVKKINIAGWSTGGAIILKFAAKYPEMVNRIVLIESASYRGYPVYKKDAKGQPLIGQYYDKIEELAKDPVQVLPMVNALESNNVVFIKQIWDMLIYNVSKPNSEDDKLYLSETMKQRNIVDIDWCLTTFNMSETSNGVTNGDNSIKLVTAPVLSLWSEKDIVVLEYMIDETVNALTNCKKVTIKNSGHSPLIDSPEELYSLMKEFF